MCRISPQNGSGSDDVVSRGSSNAAPRSSLIGRPCTPVQTLLTPVGDNWSIAFTISYMYGQLRAASTDESGMGGDVVDFVLPGNRLYVLKCLPSTKLLEGIIQLHRAPGRRDRH